MNADTLARTLTPHVNLALVARAQAELLRDEVDAIKAELLAANEYFDEYTGERITEPKDDWTMGDEAHPAYLALLDARVRAAGHNPPEGFCPALMAESTLRDAEHALIEAARVYPEFAHMTTSRLLCGTKGKPGLELHREYLDLLHKMVINHPNYVSPLA